MLLVRYRDILAVLTTPMTLGEIENAAYDAGVDWDDPFAVPIKLGKLVAQRKVIKTTGIENVPLAVGYGPMEIDRYHRACDDKLNPNLRK